MAGAIVMSPDQMWTASNSPYRWVVDYLLEKISDGPAKDEIKNIAEHGFGILDLSNPDQFTPDDRAEILRVLHQHLVADAEQRLPADLVRRDNYIGVLAELAAQAGRSMPA